MVQRRWGFFFAWIAIGAVFALSILGAMTIGMFVLPIAVGATAWLATRRHGSGGLAGLISGLGLPLLYVAYLNRAGPGTVCTVDSGGGQSCTDEWSPWPWFALGAALVIAGVFVFVARHRGKPTRVDV